MSFFTGTPGSWNQMSNLNKGQQDLQNQLLKANSGAGAGGSFGTSADYYRNLLSNNSQDFQSMAAPELRQFNEQIVPGIAEQFAGMGSGGLSSSGFRNAALNAGADLSERLGAIRAQLRQQGAAGLMNLGQQGLQQTNENVYTQGQGGLLDQLGPIAQGITSGFAGNYGGGLDAISKMFNKGGEQKLNLPGVGWKPPKPQQPGQSPGHYGIPPINQYGLRM